MLNWRWQCRLLSHLSTEKFDQTEWHIKAMKSLEMDQFFITSYPCIKCTPSIMILKDLLLHYSTMAASYVNNCDGHHIKGLYTCGNFQNGWWFMSVSQNHFVTRCGLYSYGCFQWGRSYTVTCKINFNWSNHYSTSSYTICKENGILHKLTPLHLCTVPSTKYWTDRALLSNFK